MIKSNNKQKDKKIYFTYSINYPQHMKDKIMKCEH